jgi:Tfp pilus assembly protein PilO
VTPTPHQRRRALVALLAWAALNAAVYFTYTLPRSLQERSVAARLAVLRDEVESERRAVAERRQRAQTIEANARDVGRFFREAVAARGASLVPILRQIEALARERGLRVGSQSFRHEKLGGLDLDRFVVTMPVSGAYRQLVDFVVRLEGSSFFITLDQVSARGQGPGGGQAQIDMVLSCYFRAGDDGQP